MSEKLNNKRKEASVYTKELHESIQKNKNPYYEQIENEDIDNFKKHIILNLEGQQIKDENGEVAWKQEDLEILDKNHIPDTVNPYLWKNCRNLTLAGVVQMAEGVYAVIGVQSASILFIRSLHGWIVQDCGDTYGGGKAALELVEQAIGENIHDHITAIIYSHPHVDHYGGIGAFIKEEQIGKAEDGKIPIYGPYGFEQGLVNENLYAGIAMNRRIQYQCGFLLPHDEKNWVSNGVHVTFGIGGEKATILPNELIEQDGTIEIDGVKVTFILTPDTETSAHMCTYFDDYKVLYLGDNGVGVIHNIYTMRGTPVRNGNNWGKVFYHLYQLVGNKAEVVCPGHGLPCFKSEKRPDNIKQYLLDNAAAYKYTNDQALLLANEGYSMNEIGNHFQVPESIERTWYTQGIYGNYAFNAKGVYQKYLGFYDGNPVNLAPLPERQLAEKLINYIGSEELTLEKAKKDFENGEYRWVATITSHIVYKNPENMDARYLCADAFEQLAYQEENSIRRNAYLSGAVELRNPDFAKSLDIISPMDNENVMPFVSCDLILDYLGINFDGNKAADFDFEFALKIQQKDKPDEYHTIRVYRGSILHEKVTKEDIKDFELVTISKSDLYLLAIKKYKGNNSLLKRIEEYVVDTTEYKNFNLIEPISQLQ